LARRRLASNPALERRPRRILRRRATTSPSSDPALIAAIVLAAGFARRMGCQKLLLDLKGKPVVRWSVELVLSHVSDCLVVTGQDDPAVREALAPASPCASP